MTLETKARWRTVQRSGEDLAGRSRRGFRRTATIAGAVLLSFAFVSPVRAAGGDLDPIFGGDGIVRTFITPGPSEANGVAVQADGKIVAVGTNDQLERRGVSSKFALTRYLTDGTLDVTFGGDGIVTTNFTPFRDHAFGVAVQSDGKIVAVGVAGEGGTGNAAMGVARYNTNGSLDSTFGGDGRVMIDLSPMDDYANGVAIQPDGKIVVGGLSRCCGNARFAAARLNPDGTLDTTFGGDGSVATDFSTALDFGFDVTLQSDGKIVLAGVTHLDGKSHQRFGLARYNADGSLDTTFGGDGKVTTSLTGTGDWANAAEVQPDGKIVAMGFTGGANGEWGLARYNADGTLDPTFGGDGKVTTDLTPSFDWGWDVLIQTDGKIVAVGSAGNESFALTRYDLDGTLDPTFGVNGVVTADLTPFGDIADSAAIQADGSIVVAGISGLGGRHARLTVTRFLSS